MDEVLLNGKKYISAKRASAIYAYNADYIGQLCRASKLECTSVGRAWFVTEESLRAHASAKEADPRGRKAKQYQDSTHLYIEEAKKRERAFSSFEDSALLKYESDERPLIPLISKEEPVVIPEESKIEPEAVSVIEEPETLVQEDEPVSESPVIFERVIEEEEKPIDSSSLEQEERAIPIRRPMTVESIRFEESSPEDRSHYEESRGGRGLSALALVATLWILVIFGSAFLEDRFTYSLTGNTPVMEKSSIGLSANAFSQIKSLIR